MSDLLGDAVLQWRDADPRDHEEAAVPTWKWCQACGMLQRIELFGADRGQRDGLARACRAAKNRTAAKSRATHKAGKGVRGKS